MECIEHGIMFRCNAIENSICEKCGKEMTTFNAPPLNKVCIECSEKHNICEFCSKKIESGKGE